MAKKPGTFNNDKSDTDLYLRQDPEGKAAYHRYMSKLAPNDISEKGRAYHLEEAKKHEASAKGHGEATRKTEREIALRLYKKKLQK